MNNCRTFPAIILFMAFLTIGCDHKELCFDHSGHSAIQMADIRASWHTVWEIPYEGHTDWRGSWDASAMGRDYAALNPAVPEGLRVVSYPADGAIPYSINIPPDGGMIPLPAGDQSLLFYNNDTEFIIIDNEESYARAMATTRSRSRLSYQRPGEETVSPPDMLFGSWMSEYDHKVGNTSATFLIEMRPLTFTYLIRYEFSHGIEYVALARGALAGMARGVYLHNGINSDTPATLLYDCTVEKWGAEAVVKSFGLPGFPNLDYNRSAARFMLNLEVRLYNGKTIDFDVDVSGQIAIQPYGGVIKAGPFTISDEDGKSEGSGFTVDVEDWGDEKQVDINL